MSNKVEILQKIEQYRSMHPQLSKLSEEQIISVMINDGVLTLSEAEKISVFGEQNKSDLGDSVSLRQSAYQQGKPVVVQLSDGKSYDLNQTIMNRINMVSTNLKKAEESNGFIGSAWSWVKNTTGIGDSSDDVREAQEKEKKLLQQFNNEKKRPEIFKELTGVDYTPENLEKFIKGEIKLKSEQALSGYEEGQEMATDVGADMVSGIAAVGIFTASVAAAPFTAGASIAVGLAAATAGGAAIKTGVKAADAATGGREYTLGDAKHDAVTGGFSGVLAPVTGGMGGAVGKTVATKFGIQVIKQTGKSAAQQTAKSGIKKSVETALLNPTGYEYIGGNAVKRAAAQAAEMATDGAIGGAVDNAFRTAYDGGGAEEVLQAAAEGFVGGAILSPVIGGGMKGVGVAFNRIKGIDEFSSLVTNCKSLSDDDLLNLYQYYKNYEQECIKNNKPVPDMKKAGFDKLMEEINSRGLNVDGQTPPPTPLPQGAGVNEVTQSEVGAPNGNPAGVNNSAPLAGEADLRTDDTNVSEVVRIASKANGQELCSGAWSESKTVPEGGRGVTSAEEVAPFAKHLEQTPDIQDLTNPEIKRVQLENGEFDENGNFVSDGTYTVTESGNPLAKSETFKHYPDGDSQIAQNMNEFKEQIRTLLGTDKLSEYELRSIKRLVDEHPEISIPELSEMINDFKHATRLLSDRDNTGRFLFSYLNYVDDFKILKANINEFDKFVTEIRNQDNETSKEIAALFSRLRSEYFTDKMAKINPEDFKTNLEFFKTLDPDFQNCLIHRNYNAIFESHDSKFFERLKVADDFNRFMKAAPISQKAFIGDEALGYHHYSDEQYAQLLKNIDLVKDMTNNKCENSYLTGYILDDMDGRYTDLAERVKEALGVDFDYESFVKVWQSQMPDTSIEILKAFPKQRDRISVVLLYDLGSHYCTRDEAGKKIFMDKLNIASKMPHLVSYRGTWSPERFVPYMKWQSIENADKILEFIELAEPEFLRKIDFRWGDNPQIYFDVFFAPENLDNLIECAKMHKELPQSFREYLKKSIIGQKRWGSYIIANYQYSISPQELADRIDQIKKFEGKYDPEILELIYNGSYKASDEVLDALSTIDKKLLKELIRFQHTDKIAQWNKETLDKFTNYIKNAELTDESIQTFCYNFNPEIFIRLSADELDSISFKGLINLELGHLYVSADDIKRSISSVPKKIRDIIKEDAGISKYLNWSCFGDSRQQNLNYLNSMTIEDLQAIGSKALVEYMDRNYYNFIKFNPKNLEQWKTLPQEIRAKFDRTAWSYYILSNEEVFDKNLLISRVQYLKDKNLFTEIGGDELYFIALKATPEIVKLFDDIVDKLKLKPDYHKLCHIVGSLRDYNGEDAVELAFLKELIDNPKLDADILLKVFNSLYRAGELRDLQKDFARYLLKRDDFDPSLLPEYLKIPEIRQSALELSKEKIEFAKELLDNPNIDNREISKILGYVKRPETFKEIKSLILDIVNNHQNSILVNKLPFLITNFDKISKNDLQIIIQIMGSAKVSKLSDSDLLMACQMSALCGRTSINEIPMEVKQNLLRRLVACNTGLFEISDELRKDFPLLPADRETYCSLLPAIVKSLGVDIRTIEPPSRIKEFNTNLESLSSSVAKLSDRDFTNMEITLDYPKNEFIKNALNIVKDLNPKERQKVYDYFGFELHENKNNPTGFSIIGYPINLNNGQKLAAITDPKTKSVVENLRPEVIKFSEQNRIICNNPDVQKLLNDIVDVLPELRTQIGKVQHKTHDYDVFRHSLKVMQKIAQDPKFQKLNESDKKLMMLASLLHDITKGEGYSDKTHAAQGSFDTFFITKKFNLTREEEIKLYTLTRHHEWLGYVNTAKSEAELTKRLQSVAYDLQHDNLFDMALMFTHADLRAVKSDDTFHDTKVGASRVDFNGNVRSFGESAEVHAQRIRGYIEELQKSQPLLPVTQIPKSDRINSAITKVNPDGSTNIKGVYKRPDGLVVIKFNEVEDWESIGFPKGSVSKGYMAQAGSKASDGSFAEDINTGNIKFFVHGLDYENQLAKFDAFSLIDSDVLLSVSYAERPESKYRFFRAQGVLLDFDTKYIHGGGNTDSGSGCGKFIEDFKKDYIFGGHREKDRLYVSNLIKNATGMSDEDYVKFVEMNRNRALPDIEPAEYREPIIKALAAINSNTRKGGRSYNEMYGSNPKEVMGVFAYDTQKPSNVDNPLDFLTGRTDTEFLQKYAIEHNIPFVVFGD